MSLTPEETARFETLSAQQKNLYALINKDHKACVKANQERRKEKASEWLDALIAAYQQFETNHSELETLNEEGELEHRTYFVTKMYDVTTQIYNDYKALLEEILEASENQEEDDKKQTNKPDEKKSDENQEKDSNEGSQKPGQDDKDLVNLSKKFDALLIQQQSMSQAIEILLKERAEAVSAGSSTATETGKKVQEKDESKKVQEKDEIQKVQEKDIEPTTSTKDNGQSTGGTNMMDHFVKAMYQKQNELQFPPFPKEGEDYRDWRQQVDIWEEAIGPLTGDQKKMQSLKLACAKNENAHALAKSFDMQTSFKTCLQKLDSRFLVVRNVIFKMVETLINMPSSNNGENLMRIHDTVEPTLLNLKNLVSQYVIKPEDKDEHVELKIKAKMLDGIIYALINRKLDNGTCTHIASKLNLQATEVPETPKVLKVIETKFINLRAAQTSHHTDKGRSNDNKGSKLTTPVRASAAKTSAHSSNQKYDRKSHCYICDTGTHDTWKCRKLLDLDASERFKLIKEHKVCGNCLNAKYGECKCKDNPKSFCQKCKSKHNTLLHDDKWKPRAPPQVQNAHVTVAALKARDSCMVPILPTAVVKLWDDKKFILARVFLDSGATNAFITEACAKKLNLKRKPTYAEVSTYCGSKGAPVKEEIVVMLTPHFESVFSMEVTAFVTETLGGNIPTRPVYCELGPERLDLLQMADLEWDEPGRIDMILGTTEMAQVLRPSQ